MDQNLSVFLFVFVLPCVLIALVVLAVFFFDHRTQLALENKRQPIQYSYYLLHAMDYIAFSAMQKEVVEDVTKCWLSALGDMDAYRRYATYDSSYEEQLGIALVMESGGSYTVAGTRCILLLRPQERTVPAIHLLLTGMGWEHDGVAQIEPKVEMEQLPQEIRRQYTDDGCSLYPENGDE